MGVRRRKCRVGCGGHSDDTATVRNGAQHVVTLHSRGVPDRARPGVRHEDRLGAGAAGIDAGLIGGVRDVDREAKLVHSLDGLSTEDRESPVDSLTQAAAEGVSVRVRDTDLAKTEPEQHVETLNLILDRCRRLEPEDETDLAHGLRAVYIVNRANNDDVALVGNVRLAHAEVRDDVEPAPGRVSRHARRAVHHVVKDDRHARSLESGEGRVLTTRAVVRGSVAHVVRKPDGVIVQADHKVLVHQSASAQPFFGTDRPLIRRHSAELGGEIKGRKVDARVEVAVGCVGLVAHRASDAEVGRRRRRAARLPRS